MILAFSDPQICSSRKFKILFYSPSQNINFHIDCYSKLLEVLFFFMENTILALWVGKVSYLKFSFSKTKPFIVMKPRFCVMEYMHKTNGT